LLTDDRSRLHCPFIRRREYVRYRFIGQPSASLFGLRTY
jgi:hypothetical protein